MSSHMQQTRLGRRRIKMQTDADLQTGKDTTTADVLRAQHRSPGLVEAINGPPAPGSPRYTS
jgi:hypothetical protein